MKAIIFLTRMRDGEEWESSWSFAPDKVVVYRVEANIKQCTPVSKDFERKNICLWINGYKLQGRALVCVKEILSLLDDYEIVIANHDWILPEVKIRDNMSLCRYGTTQEAFMRTYRPLANSDICFNDAFNKAWAELNYLAASSEFDQYKQLIFNAIIPLSIGMEALKMITEQCEKRAFVGGYFEVFPPQNVLLDLAFILSKKGKRTQSNLSEADLPQKRGYHNLYSRIHLQDKSLQSSCGLTPQMTNINKDSFLAKELLNITNAIDSVNIKNIEEHGSSYRKCVNTIWESMKKTTIAIENIRKQK